MGSTEMLQIHSLPGLLLPETGAFVGNLWKNHKHTNEPAAAGLSDTAAETPTNMTPNPATFTGGN